MTSVLQEQDAPGSPAPLALADMRVRFPARVVAAGWPATTANREETLGRLTCAPFVSDVVELGRRSSHRQATRPGRGRGPGVLGLGCRGSSAFDRIVEELLEISHHSLVQYRLPGTGELVPLLQIVPSKTDTERLLVVSPELADVLSVIIRRIRGDNEAMPLVRHTTVTNACGSARHRCCSTAGSAPTTAGSATARSATCSTPPWPAPV
jgi:hypothetical protein